MARLSLGFSVVSRRDLLKDAFPQRLGNIIHGMTAFPIDVAWLTILWRCRRNQQAGLAAGLYCTEVNRMPEQDFPCQRRHALCPSTSSQWAVLGQGWRPKTGMVKDGGKGFVVAVMEV